MTLLDTLDWHKMFVLQTPILEIFIRGSIVYVGLFIMLRVVLKRESGTLGITDLLVVVLLADAAQNAMADGYHSISHGFILIATIVFWSYFLNYLGFKFPWFQNLIKPPTLLLVKDGKMIKRNMKEELVTKDELMSEIRSSGLTSLEEVKEAYMEPNGRISIIRKSKEPNASQNQKQVF